MPKEVLDTLQLLRDVGASFRPLLLKPFCLLLEDRQPHCDVKPVQQMLAEWMKVLLHASDVLASIGHEYHLLILPHSLRFHQLPESPAWLLVIGLHKPKHFAEGTSVASSRRKATTLLPPDTSKHPCLCAART